MFSRKLIAVTGLTAAALLADLPDWISTIEVRNKLEEVFYRSVTFGSNVVSWRKPPKETRPALTQQLQQAPADAQLYYLRAREAEAQLDFAGADADWTKYAQLSPARAQAWGEKAAYHQRRAEPEKELAALLEAAKLPATGQETYRPVRSQQAWQALERAARLVADQLLSDDRASDVFRARETRYPAEAESYTRFAAWLTAKKRWPDLEALIPRYEKAFPGDAPGALQMRAAMERGRSGPAGALALYERSLRPDWADVLWTAYFQLLDETGGRRQFAAAARQRQLSDPSALDPAARLFQHYRLTGDTGAAQRVLHEFSKARGSRWTPSEQLIVAGFYASVQNLEEAARRYHAAYNSNDVAASEAGLANLIELLVQQAAQPFRFGGGDLSLYRDIATLDANPGFWNGILSLVLNRRSPGSELAEQERKAIPYFHRAAAAQLLSVFDARFPRSPRRAALHAGVIEAAALHVESDRVIRLGTAFLATFPDVSERTRIALATADAHARLNQTQPEFALYDALLNELAGKAGRVPIGENAGSARNPDYPRVLDRYIARLVAMKQPAQALTLYRRELDRNPNDPGLYERLAAFLEQNKMTGEIEATYRRAIQQFPDKSWSHKLARFFLRQKMNAQFDQFSREAAAAFSGTELQAYLSASAQQGSLDPVLYLQVNLYAYRRFPHHLPFVKNLMAAYESKLTPNPGEWERLLRANWVYDEGLRSRFFEYLSRNRKLDAELASLQSQTNGSAVAALWVAEAEAWKGHFETAAPLLKTVAADFPADIALVGRAAALHRSLGQLDVATQLEETLAQAHPADTVILTRLGEMQAERERYDRAAGYWNRIIAIAPGRAANYLEAATLHWDYYRYDEALARINEGRQRLGAPHLFGFEAGAIRENQGDLAAAASEYVGAALEDGPESNARQRLLKVAARPVWRQPVDAALAASGSNAKTLALRVALLESQARRDDLASLLSQAVSVADPDLLAEIRQHAQRSGLTAVERRVLERNYALADHPAAKMAALADRLRFEEAANAAPAAAQAAETLLRENPRSAGAIRTAVNYFWRAGQKGRAADILLAASPKAYPELGRQFRLEAIQKLADAGDYARAHRELAPLLTADALDEQVVYLKADLFARAKDDQSLNAFYRDTLAALQKSQMPSAAKLARGATLRRAWIPALVRLNDNAAAADQYIELLKQYPDDENLQGEAARFASANGQRERITNYFAKAESDSPRDGRWPVVRARLENEFGDFNAALAAWGRAVAIRPDRVDLLSNRASLEERLSQFDKAAASYRKLYEISFRNPAWLESGARVLARQGKAEESAKWLREALVDNRPAAAANNIAVAARLQQFGQLEQARAEVQKALGFAAGADLDSAAALFASISAIQRQLDQIPAVLNPRAAGMSADRVAQYKQRWLSAAAVEAGRLYTPEEKTRFGLWLEAQRAGVSTDAAVAAATEAGLADTAARLLAQALMANPGADTAPNYLDRLVTLQTQRQQFAELGRQIEAYQRAHPNPDERIGLLRRARRAFFAAGDDAGEIRTLNALQAANSIAEDELERFFELNTRRAPAVFSARQMQDGAFLDSLANYALRTAKAPIVAQAIANRRSPLWQNAMRAVTGLYLNENSPAVRKAFLDVLGPERIGDKLALAGNRDSTLAGDNWFYYAGRYGAWLQLAQDGNSPHYLAALVERRSNSATAYLALGEESGGSSAEQAYRTALILDPHQPVAYARLAALAANRAEKADLYRKALEELRWWQENRRIQEWFWTEAGRVMRDAASAGLNQELRDPADALIRGYVKRNGSYRVRELLEGVLELAGDPAAGVQWIAQISRSAAEPAGFLAQLNSDNWLPESGRESLMKLQLDFALDRLGRAVGEDRAMALENVESARIRYASFLLKNNRAAAARPVVDALSANPGMGERADVVELRLLLAAADKKLETVLSSLTLDAEALRNQGNNLKRAGYTAEANAVFRASYELDLKNGNVESAIPGLASLYLEAGAPEKAVPLLDVYVMQADIPFGRHQSTAELFLRNKRKAEAIRYLEPLAAAEPWNHAARALLAEARDDDAATAAVLNDPLAAYDSRVRAAQWIAANRPRPTQSGSGELDVLAANTTTDRAAEQPLWTAGRRAAALASKENAVKIRLYRGLLAISPNDEDAVRRLFRLLLQSGRPREAISSIEDRQYLASDPEDRARLADAYVRINQLQRALNTFDMLREEGTTEQNRRWQAAAAAVRAQWIRDEQNQLRRPTVGEPLEQSNLIKPRL
ncbi:MAG TPA: hypothetical protein VFQ91_25965, partial [Bryobacteraceae bacterium]|nr:hypothetical protein [Bryobacteraceae bacterium]